jgi:hypothetical protein
MVMAMVHALGSSRPVLFAVAPAGIVICGATIDLAAAPRGEVRYKILTLVGISQREATLITSGSSHTEQAG